jgi:hypothetical protein
LPALIPLLMSKQTQIMAIIDRSVSTTESALQRRDQPQNQQSVIKSTPRRICQPSHGNQIIDHQSDSGSDVRPCVIAPILFVVVAAVTAVTVAVAVAQWTTEDADLMPMPIPILYRTHFGTSPVQATNWTGNVGWYDK